MDQYWRSRYPTYRYGTYTHNSHTNRYGWPKKLKLSSLKWIKSLFSKPWHFQAMLLTPEGEFLVGFEGNPYQSRVLSWASCWKGKQLINHPPRPPGYMRPSGTGGRPYKFVPGTWLCRYRIEIIKPCRELGVTVPYTNETLKTVFTSTVNYRYFTVLAGYRFGMCVLGPYDGYVNAKIQLKYGQK